MARLPGHIPDNAQPIRMDSSPDQKRFSEMKDLTKQRGACIGVWLTSSVAPTGWWDRAYIYDPKVDDTFLITSDGTVTRPSN
jgi:uncharacterized protein (DUF2147 family)